MLHWPSTGALTVIDWAVIAPVESGRPALVTHWPTLTAAAVAFVVGVCGERRRCRAGAGDERDDGGDGGGTDLVDAVGVHDVLLGWWLLVPPRWF